MRRRKLKVKTVSRGRVCKRMITDLGWISSNEARNIIEVTLRYLYHLVELRRLNPVKRNGRLFFRFKEVKKFLKRLFKIN